VLLFIALLFASYLTMGIFQTRSLRRASLLELGALYDRWNQAGRPTDAALGSFMEGRDGNFVVSNIMLRVDARTYRTQFAMKRIKTSEAGALFVTTNREFIFWLPPNPPELRQLLNPAASRTPSALTILSL
jgi:hypothetical protein